MSKLERDFNRTFDVGPWAFATVVVVCILLWNLLKGGA